MKKLIPILLILLLLAAGVIFRAPLLALGRAGWTAAGTWIAQIRVPKSEIDNALVASGAIEAHTLDIAGTIGGRIASLRVAEGQSVAAGDLIAELDTALIDAEIAQAQAAKRVAEAQVAALQAGARAADEAVAQAGVAQAQAGQDAAYTVWQDALALIDAPNELDVKIAQAAAALEVAGEQVTAAGAAATAADLEQALWARTVESLAQGVDVPVPGGDPVHVDAPADKLGAARLQWNLASQRTWEAHARTVSAGAVRDAARQTLADLRSQRAAAQTARSQADAAGAAHALAAAAVEVAQANLDVVRAGAPPEQIAAAQTAVDQADAALAALRSRRSQARIVAPRAGTVTSVARRAGEVVAAGSAIVQIADLSEVTLTLYVPETQIGQVAVGGLARIAVDSLPGRVITGTVTHIADRAEFTPKNVQTRDARSNLVFAVDVVVANPDGALKPGMPADATFCAAADCGPAAQGAAADQPAAADAAAITASGAIEATEYAVAAEMGGRAVQARAAEGDAVTAGQALVELDAEELTARKLQADAAVAAARAELARITAQPQAARVAQAEAQVRQAAAALASAEVALANARRLRDQPQELDAQINTARGQAATAAAAIDTARAALKSAQVLQESLPNPGSDQDRTRRAMYDQQVAAAGASVRAAEAQARGALSVVAQLRAIRQRPVALDAAVHRAAGEVARAEAALAAARAVLAQVQAPAGAETVAAAQARVAQAQAAEAIVDVTLGKLMISSPVAGRITGQSIRAGEVAQAGAPLFTVADMQHVKLVIYVSTSRIGQVRLDQAAAVTVDAYPGRTFSGVVAHIADQAEYTPKNVQTQEERVKTVFAVEITLENEEGLLRAGMPADAVLEP